VIVRAIEEFPAPVIALIEGSVWGGAFELIVACDIVVATPESTFAFTPAKLSIPYNISGLLTFMTSFGLHAIKEMAFTAKSITAQRALELGIVNHVIGSDEITEYCKGLAREIEKLAPLSIAVMKEELRILASAHSITPNMFERIQGLRRQVYDSHDYQEGVKAFLERRAPHFTGD
jgi:methylmalonyl-CoA decarboxylase